MAENISDIPLISNRYGLLTELGRGGMGVVYRAIDRLDGSVIALKRVTTPGERMQFASKADMGDKGDSADFSPRSRARISRAGFPAPSQHHQRPRLRF